MDCCFLTFKHQKLSQNRLFLLHFQFPYAGFCQLRKLKDIVLRFAYLRLFHQDWCHVHEPSPEGQILGRSKYHLIQIFETIIADQAGVLPVVVGNIWRKLMILFR
ncbi:hypothetical protein NC652_026781 [Populus alba x Populus x berolinensis]|nr:hypothetical protein NC652_026781 [Populus alba x Populus x berolinensis]